MNVEQSFFDEMKTKRKRTETISETATVLILKNSNIRTHVEWCESCAAEVVWIAPKSAAQLIGLSPRSIYRLLESGAIHFTEASDEEPQICSSSLLIFTDKGDIGLCSQR